MSSSKENNRRNFIKGIGLGSLFLGSVQYGLNANTNKENKKPHYAMIYDQNKCVGCSDCEIACQEINLVPKNQHRLYVEDQTKPDDLQHKKYMRVSCQQCIDSPCTEVCPTGACHKDSITDIVTMDIDKCIGCKYCIVACPYDVRFINERTNAAENCNFCLNTNFAKGKDPACVESCKYDALVFGDLNDETAYINKILDVKDAVRLKPGFGTKPSLRYIPKLKTGVYDE
ncbi:nitrite reductase [Malaciobacter molluscorum LMG 25693]|uniref:Nitrite reductase n=1 Tax=Malaciobacter molluscorum LMG 25693 TaxID=870501 RepID=A0A2G1DK39_9BACT|nr:4Fe-4S dicluster domain-containing protein [Malaciobacter molluscorum]AXX92934.1 cytochrome c nitrite reductase [Fe-S] subunit NrfC [Malaciobacter molluscorum LMG 25693]PHO18764.1 nitrite reductase [Malaciobacter molluscorum LMG 25693]